MLLKLYRQCQRIMAARVRRISQEKILGKALASGGDSSIIELPKSIGAKARSQKVKMPNGQYGKIKENSKITKVVVYAEKGAKNR